MDPLFDTNVFIDIQDGCISASQYQVAKEKIAADGLTGRFSPLSLIELGSHINDANQTQFPRYQGALRVARDLCRGLLTVRPRRAPWVAGHRLPAGPARRATAIE